MWHICYIAVKSGVWISNFFAPKLALSLDNPQPGEDQWRHHVATALETGDINGPSKPALAGMVAEKL